MIVASPVGFASDVTTRAGQLINADIFRNLQKKLVVVYA
jgi:hypothetical protein